MWKESECVQAGERFQGGLGVVLEGSVTEQHALAFGQVALLILNLPLGGLGRGGMLFLGGRAGVSCFLPKGSSTKPCCKRHGEQKERSAEASNSPCSQNACSVSEEAQTERHRHSRVYLRNENSDVSIGSTSVEPHLKAFYKLRILCFQASLTLALNRTLKNNHFKDKHQLSAC